MAFSSVWIAVASIIATLDITKAIDENGNVIEPSHEYLSALVWCVNGCIQYSIASPHVFP